MVKLGFGRCEHLPAYRHTGPQACCALRPSRWEPLDPNGVPEVVNA